MKGNALAQLRILSSLFGTYLILVGAVIIGFIGHFFYWLIFDVLTGGNRSKNQKLSVPKELKDDEYYALIIGSGFSGLGMAIKLNQLGMDKYVVIERFGHIGGTWYANKYPGCACDVPSNLYSFSFEPNPKWSYFFSRQPEIGEYLEHCADKYDVRRHVQFNTTVTELRWLDDRQVWQITTQTKDKQDKIFYARFVMAGYGPLSNANYPTDIPGMDKFQGQMCHTAEWDQTIDFNNKRVAVIGTGASAIQAVPEIQKSGVTQLLVFQRTPPWVIPRADRPVTEWEKQLFARFPIIQKFIRGVMYWIRESTVLSFTHRLPTRFLITHLAKFNLYRQVKDPELRKKITPAYDLGCKRVLVTNDWYPAIQQPNVKIVTNRIKEVTSNSIATYDGDEYPVDIIIWCTGYKVQSFPLPIYGVNGRSLTDQWSQTMQAFRGVTVPNFPNLFLLLGPNTGLGHNSVVIMIEAQIHYLAELLLHLEENHFREIDVKEKSHDEYNRNIQSSLKKTVWQVGGCHSWYQDAKGNNTTIWPGFTWTYILFMKHFDPESYRFQ